MKDGSPQGRSNTSGFAYVRKEKSRHGTVFYRFRWRGRGRKIEHTFDEDYRSPEFRLKHALLEAEVAAVKAGVEDAGAASVERTAAPSKAKPGTFRWLCERYWNGSEFKSRTKASERTKEQSKRVLARCLQEPIDPGAPDKETFGDYPLEGGRAMRLSDLEILRDRAASKKKVAMPDGRKLTFGGLSAADKRVKHLKRLFGWAVKHREVTHIETDIAAHLDWGRGGYGRASYLDD